jgi:hypothetical protein
MVSGIATSKISCMSGAGGYQPDASKRQDESVRDSYEYLRHVATRLEEIAQLSTGGSAGSLLPSGRMT